MIPYGHQDITEADIEAVVKVLRSDWLTQGPVVPKFEQAIAGYCGADYAVAVNSGTSALHIACLALGLGPGDTLWTSPNTFVASANCALYCGANIDFIDIDPRTYNMSAELLEKKLKKAEKLGALPNIVIPVHFAGQSCDMESIKKLSDRYGFTIIEDASHAVGGRYKSQPVGDCKYSDITVFSFHPVKIITTGEGGMALTCDSVLYEKMAELRSHGITRNSMRMHGVSHGPWYYQQVELGYNYRMTDMQAALGLSQLDRLDEYVRHRHEIANRYDKAFTGLPLTTPWHHLDVFSAYHLYVITLQLDSIQRTRKEVFEALREAGVGVNVHYIPVHTQPCYLERGFSVGEFNVAESYYEKAISLPLFPGLTQDQQDNVILEVKRCLQ